MMWGNGFNWLSMTLMVLGSALGITLLVVLVWTMMRRLNIRTASSARRTPVLPGSGSTAVEILSQRYARGEIDATTFEQMRERLEATDNAQQSSRAEGRRPAGERLFDGY